MNVFKRLEIWILLLVILAGLAWVFMSGSANEEEDLGSPGGTTATKGTDGQMLKLYRSVLQRDYGNARLDIDLRVRNDKGEKLVLQTPAAKLLTAQGKEVPSFFLPFEPLPEVSAKSTQDVQLRYWLEAADLQGALTLDVNGTKLEIKAAKPFSLESVTNGEPGKTIFKSSNW